MPFATSQNGQRRKRPLSDESNTKSTAETTSSNKSEEVHAAPWRALFYFTTKANLPLLFAGIALSIIGGATSPAQSYIIGKVFQGFTSFASGQIEADEFIHHEKNYVYYLLIISGGSWLVDFLDFAVWLAYGELQAKSARDRLFYGLLEKDIEWYDMRKHGIGALLPRLQAQIRELQLACAQPLGGLVTIIATAILSLVQALVRSWQLTLVIISTVPVVMFAVAWIGRNNQRILENHHQALTEAEKFSTNAFTAIETVKCFNGQHIEKEKYMASISKAASWYCRMASANAAQMALITLLSVSMFVQGFYYGGVLIVQGKLNTGDVITCFVSAVSAFQALNGILPQLMVLEKGRRAGATLRAVMAHVQKGSNFRKPDGKMRPGTCHGDINVSNLTFLYPSRPLQPALNNVSMFIPGGDITFLIGRSGSGKSTLGQLLMRFYTATHGSISLDGVELESLDANWLRSNITLVEQTSLLFNDTVFRNIAFGHHDPQIVTKEQVLETVEFALLQLMINDMPNGLETVVGYKGGAMSGGQRQRMALARARLRDTPILILDESTSALDSINRALMMDAIRWWRRDRTTIIITHDITQILPDDYAYILEHGSLVQEGYRKHMEKLKDTPFQNFLPKDQRATTQPFDSRKGTAFESIRLTSLSMDSTSKRLSELIADPLEEQLNAIPKERATTMPQVLQHAGPIPAVRGRTDAVATFATPWVRLAKATQASPPSDDSQTARWSGWWTSKDNGNNVGPTQSTAASRKRLSPIMESLVNKTGIMAATSRARGVNRPKRLRTPDMDIEGRRSRKASLHPTLGDVEQAVEDAPTPVLSLAQIVGTFWPAIDLPVKMVFVLGFVGSTIHGLSSPIFSYILSKLLKIYSIPGGDQRESLMYSMIILGISIVDAICTWMFRFCLEYSALCWVNNIRDQAIERILDQERAFFDKEENAVSRLADGLDQCAEEMKNIVGRFIGMMYVALLMVSIALTWAIVTQWKLTLITLCAAPYMFLVSKAFAAVADKWEGLSNDAAQDAAAIFTETFTNIKTVRALTLEKHFLEKYLKATNYALNVGFRRSFFAGFFYGLSDSAGNFSIAMIFYVGAVLVKDGTSVEHVVQVFTMLMFAITNVTGTLAYVPQIGASKDMASRLLRLAQLPKDSHEHLGNTRIATVGDIVLDDLQFSYPSRPKQTVLKHINLHIKPGTSTAIVGGSGSGKSTIANLLLNLYTTQRREGLANHHRDLTLSGRSIKHIHTPSLRSLIVPVSQTPTLFAATVADNIAYGLPIASQSKVEAAARQAGIHDFITSLPQGYRTPIGDGGMGLSGGQAQRIAIARAIVRRPAVLILDEATSALDVQSADLVRRTLESLVHDRTLNMTVIIITHNRQMMEIAENVVVLDQGRIVEVGGFEELLERNGALTNLLSGGEWTGDMERDTVRKTKPVALLKEVNWLRKARAQKT